MHISERTASQAEVRASAKCLYLECSRTVCVHVYVSVFRTSAAASVGISGGNNRKGLQRVGYWPRNLRALGPWNRSDLCQE